MALNLISFQLVTKGWALKRWCSVFSTHWAPLTREWVTRAFMDGGWGEAKKWGSSEEQDTVGLAGGEAVLLGEELLPGTEWKLRN